MIKPSYCPRLGFLVSQGYRLVQRLEAVYRGITTAAVRFTGGARRGQGRKISHLVNQRLAADSR
jgi:hypothetical protein